MVKPRMSPPSQIKPKSLEITEQGIVLEFDVTYDTPGPTTGSIFILVTTPGEIGALIAPMGDILKARGFK